ncbi:hypothetical protein C8J56DRAFT_1164358 [Mycena floridula]|nr:hypothetical protein C8J56DRAFT_1164358 [Mycena floridula]
MLSFIMILLLTFNAGNCLVIGISGQPMANGTGVVAWNRDRGDSDPQDFVIVKVKLDENPAETSTPFTVHAAGSTSGLYTIPFNLAGIFNIVALDNKTPIATASTFGVIPFGIVVTTTSTAVFVSPTTDVSSMSVSETSVPEPVTSTPRSNNTAAVVGAAVSGGILALMLLITVTIIVRRVIKIKNDHSPAITRTYDIKYVNPSTEKTPLEPNIGSAIRRMQSMSSSTLTERQLELQGHAQDLEGQIERLQDLSGDVYNEIQRLRNQVSWLLSQQNSDWALGITDEPPPEYMEEV